MAIKTTFMDPKNIGLRIAGTIFAIVALAHLLRLITAVPVIISNWFLPYWISAVGLVVTGSLCLWLWVISFRKDDK